MISVVILTKNEEKNILDCLDSVSWADEIVIVDDDSEDRTLEVIESILFRSKIKIFEKKLNGDFSSQRNFAISKTKFDWVLFVDADERISKELRKEINDVLIKEKSNPSHNGYYIPRKDILWGKLLKHGETGSMRLLRLAKKDSGTWMGKVHEEWKIKGNTSDLKNCIFHYPHQTISEFLKEINLYTTIRAKELYEDKSKISIKQIIFYPKAKFILNYFFKLGFLDGIEGLIFAILMSFHSFLVRAKLWTYSKK